jgi:hypothetical protein
MAEQSLLAAVLLHQALNFFEYLQAGTGFPRGFPRFPTGPSLSSRFPGSVEPRRGIPAAAPNGLWFVHHPCRFRPDRAPWPPSSSTRSSTSSSTPGGRRISSRSPSISTGIPLPSRFLDSVEPRCEYRGRSPGWTKVCPSPLSVTAQTEPPGRHPPAPGPQLLRATQAEAGFPRGRNLDFHRSPFPLTVPGLG